MRDYNKLLTVPISLLDNVTCARIYWQMQYTGYEELPKSSELRQAIESAIKVCESSISETYDDPDVLYDFLESVRKEVVY